MKFIDDIKSLFITPSAEQLAQRQLEEAERSLLKHHDAMEYHAAMVGYLQSKVERLADYLDDEVILGNNLTHLVDFPTQGLGTEPKLDRKAA